MANEHIGRKVELGFAKEPSYGTTTAATQWLPKESGMVIPKNVVDTDSSSYGNIDEIKEAQTVMSTTEITFQAILRDVFLGLPLLSTFGTETPTLKFTTGAITGTFVEGETITEATSLATGVLIRSDAGQVVPTLYISVVTGTFVGAKVLTGGTSGATTTGTIIELPAAACRWHVFRRANTNTHTSLSISVHDPVSDDRAVGCMMDQIDIEIVVGKFARVTCKMMGKKLTLSVGAQTPSYSTQNAFLAKYANVYVASIYNSLDAASPLAALSKFKLTIKKNLEVVQGVGATDIAGIYNKQFTVEGSLELLYNVTTYRDYLATSTKQALRLKMANTDKTIGAATNPLLQFDMPVVAFKDWSRPGDNNNISRQTLTFQAEYDAITGMTIQALLANNQTAAY